MLRTALDFLGTEFMVFGWRRKWPGTFGCNKKYSGLGPSKSVELGAMAGYTDA